MSLRSGDIAPDFEPDWQQGDDVIVTPAVTNDQLKTKFPKGVTFVKPYLRTTPQPDK